MCVAHNERMVSVTTSDGRQLEVLLAGPEDGFPLVFHHGTPQGAVPNPLLERPAAERGLRVISYSRPGYGESTPRQDGATTATVADDADDTAAILDHLGYDEFVTLGWSGGGPRSLACAAMLPDRCRAATCGVGIAPRAEFDGDIRDGMGRENVEEYTAAFAGAAALEEFLAHSLRRVLRDRRGRRVVARRRPGPAGRPGRDDGRAGGVPRGELPARRGAGHRRLAGRRPHPPAPLGLPGR